MIGNFSVNGANTTVTISQTAPTAMVQTTIDYFAHYLWNNELTHDKEWEELSNQDKLDMVAAEILRVIRKGASQYGEEVAVDATIAQTRIELQNLLLS